ncbi:MAG: TVP38/TMEM64 family protein [Stackebrandtia sp.]
MTPSPARARVRRFVYLVAGVAVFAALALLFGPRDPAAIKELAGQAGVIAPALAVVGTALGIVVMIPRTFMSIASGMLFGWLAGFVYVILGTMLGAAAGFAIGRLLGREFVAVKLRRWSKVEPGEAPGLRVKAVRWTERGIARGDSLLERHGVLGIWIARIIPLSHFGFLSYVCGTASVRTAPYLVGTLIGAIPGSLGYTAVGGAAFSVGGLSLALGLAVGMNLLSLALVTLVRRCLLRKKLADLQPEV